MSRVFRAGFYTDIHFKRTPPQSRTDDYPTAILKKLTWILNYFRKIKVDFIFDGGDLFDRAIQSPWEIMATANVLKEASVPICTVAGNHPIKGNYEAWKPFSGLHTLARVLNAWDTHQNYMIIDGYKVDVQLPLTQLTFRLHHIDLVRRPVMWDHVLWEDYDAGDANVILVSHYHPQQGVWQRDDGVWFVSPGAVSRGSLGEDNVCRTPAVAVIEFTKKEIKNIELIDIPCTPGEEVFNLSTVLKVEDVERDLEAYESCVAALRDMEDEQEATLAPEEILKTIAKSTKAGKLVLDYTLDKLEEVRK